jgi:hypothetical protein
MANGLIQWKWPRSSEHRYLDLLTIYRISADPISISVINPGMQIPAFGNVLDGQHIEYTSDWKDRRFGVGWIFKGRRYCSQSRPEGMSSFGSHLHPLIRFHRHIKHRGA